MLYIVLSMGVVFVGDSILGLPLFEWLHFNWALIKQGQIWRLITFVFLPGTSSMISLFFTVLFYYFVGTNLERLWGKSTFTLYYLVGILGAIVSGIITGYTTNTYLNLSLFLAFAFLYPDAQFLLYFIIPIKAKYLAIVNLVVYFFSIVSAIYYKRWWNIAALIASLINFIIFFGPNIYRRIKRKIVNTRRRRQYEKDLRNPRD